MNRVPKLRFKEFSGEWEEKSFQHLAKLQRGSSPRPIVKYVTKADDGVNWIKIGDTKLSGIYINSTAEKITKEGALKSRKVHPGEIILSNSMSYGKPYILNIDGYIHDGWFVIREFENSFELMYLYQLLASEWIQKQYKRLAAGGVVDNISSELVNAVQVNLPTKSEQKKIASFLSTVDSKIDLLTRKKELLEQYKQGVMKKIFSQELRFKADDGSAFPEWEEKKLGSFIKEYKKKSIINDEYPVFTSSHKGLMLQSDYFGENRLVERENIGFNIIPEGYITYRSRSDNRIFTFNVNDLGMPGVISIYYPVFEFQNGDNHFFVEYANFHRHTFGKYSVGTSQTVLSLTEIKNIKMKLPIKQEQQKIVNFLSAIDTKIDFVTKQLDEVKSFKKGLLQQMFV